MPYSGKHITVTLTNPDGTDIIEGMCTAEIGDINMSADDVDVTCYGPGNVRKKMQGLIDLGTLDITLNYADNSAATGLYNAFANGTSLSVVLTMSAMTPNETLTFSGHISAFGQTQPIDGVIRHPLTLTLDGTVAPHWGVVST